MYGIIKTEYTMIHHSLPHLLFKKLKEWDGVTLFKKLIGDSLDFTPSISFFEGTSNTDSLS
ncbi:hypothetical protein D9754_09960 [Planomicrobium sp. Y74]|nr:hypothetical protein D9754_09960 [Planomicrobium sp. Y74]